MRRIDKYAGKQGTPKQGSSDPSNRYGFNQWASESFGFDGHPYQVFGNTKVAGPQIGQDGSSLITGVHYQHPVVSAAVYARALLVSQIKFQWRDRSTRNMFGNAGLAPLEQPQAGMSLPQLLAMAENHWSYHGNAYFYRPDPNTIELLDPEKVAVVAERDRAQGTSTPLEYLVFKERAGMGEPVLTIPAGRVAHSPALDLDPANKWFGRSWVSTLIREITQDFQATQYVDAFYKNGAAPSLLIGVPSDFDEDQVNQFAELARKEYGGSKNAHKMMIIGNGSDVHKLGSNISDLGLGESRGEFESRVAARSRVPAVVLGVPTAAVIGGSALNAGNYTTTRRTWHDTWLNPTVQALCATLEHIIVPPNSNTQLWFDTQDVAFVQEDRTDEAAILQSKAGAMLSLINGGFKPDTIVAAVEANNLSLLAHSGLASVQLQPLGADTGDITK